MLSKIGWIFYNNFKESWWLKDLHEVNILEMLYLISVLIFILEKYIVVCKEFLLKIYQLMYINGLKVLLFAKGIKTFIMITELYSEGKKKH